MNSAEIQLRGVIDPRLAAYACSNQPAWLWSLDGVSILWANTVGARLFGAQSGAALAEQNFSPADPHRRQIMQLGGRLLPDTAPRLERLRGFGAALGSLMTCACTRLLFPDGQDAILIVAAAPQGRGMPLTERLQRLVDDFKAPVAAFTRDGAMVAASAAARELAPHLTDALPDAVRKEALQAGRAETPASFGGVTLHRIGAGHDTALIALLEIDAIVAPIAEPETVIAEDDNLSAPADVEHSGQDDRSEQNVSDQPASQTQDDVSEDEISPLEAAIDATVIRDGSGENPAPIETPATPNRSPYGETIPDTAPAQPDATFATARMERRIPLRFMWQMDAEGHFSLGSDEFTRLIGSRTAAGFGRRWSEIVAAFDLDPDGRVAKAIATRETWSGITLLWPADGGMRLAVELSAVPIYDREARFAGYRGFGVCRDLYRLTRLANQRQHELYNDPPPRSLTAADIALTAPANAPASESAETSALSPEPNRPDIAVETPVNVVQFRPGDPRSPMLTPVENNAFNELARQLSARLESETGLTGEARAKPQSVVAADHDLDAATTETFTSAPAGALPHDRALLDLLPVGVLVARLDKLLYANPAFLDRMRYPTLQALEDAGGLDALYVGPDTSISGAALEAGTAVTMSSTRAAPDHSPELTEARLFTIGWDGEAALALICAQTYGSPAAAPEETVAAAEPPPPGGMADAEDLGAILDTMAEGIVMFDADGQIHSCNRSAEALFGYDGEHLTQQSLADLFVPESRGVISDCLDNIKGAAIATLLDNGREALAHVNGGGIVPLSVTLGRTRQDGPNFFAVFRDLTQAKKTETELQLARRAAERGAGAKTDVLARVSHEVRTPLNAIIGFAEVMTDERFGALGNERYVEYMKDIRASGERVMTIIGDLLDLSRIESGQLDLDFTNENLNDMVEQCVSVMQPQANRARIIIRSSLGHQLPAIVADARALRQIVLNLIGNSIQLANAGGQVIVSTAVTDSGEVALRVRDTGLGMNDNELAAAMEPFNSPTPGDHTADSTGINLSLTRALIGANRARFQIRTAPTSGTLIEVIFALATETA